jgi:membrane protein DedA with SNARE-associated domain
MVGVPDALEGLGWWAIVAFLFVVVLLRAQATYWAGRWLRRGADSVAHRPSETPADPHGDPAAALPPPTRSSRLARRLSGPEMDRAQRFLERWGFIGIPLSFLTVGFQTLINATAGYIRMRWDLYTLAMLPGCVAWALVYGVVSLSLIEIWKSSPWLLVGVLVAVVGIAWATTRLRRSAGSGARTPQ